MAVRRGKTQSAGRVLKLSLVDLAQLAMVLYIAAWVISPPLMVSVPARLLALACGGLWLAIEVFRDPTGGILTPGIGLTVIAFAAISGIIAYATEGTAGLIADIQTYIALLFALFLASYRRRGLWQLRPAFWCTMLLLSVWILRTLVGYEEQPNASRLMTRSGEIQESLAAAGVGGYALIYTLAMTVPLVMYLAGRRSSLTTSARVALAVVLAMSCFCILRAGFSIAVLLALIGGGTTFLVKRVNGRTLVVMALAATGLLTAWPYLRENVSTASENSLYQQKVADTLFLVEGGEVAGTMDSRVRRYEESVARFLESPVFGTMSVSKTGGHSSLLDRFARHGIGLGSLFAFLLLNEPIRTARRARGHEEGGLCIAIAIVVGIFCTVNTVFAGFGLVIYLLYPVGLGYIEEGRMIERELLSAAQRGRTRNSAGTFDGRVEGRTIEAG